VLARNGDQGEWLSFSVHDRLRVGREVLLLAPPCATRRIDGEEVDLIADWVAKRYTRAAFPDAFNDRLVPAAKKIERVLKRRGEFLCGIYLTLSSWGELPDGEPYEVILRATMLKSDMASRKSEQQSAEAVDELAAVMSSCDGIDVIDASLVSESEFSLDDLRNSARWDFDHRSLSGDPGGPTGPDT
jgi:hypothetical protein